MSQLGWTLFTDGASRGNPGPAGAGAVLLDAEGRELAARSLWLGHCTNNVAEYRALLLGLQAALEQGCGRLAIRLDSELIVRQLQGRYQVKNEALKPLFTEVKSLLARLEGWSVAHVPRAQNKRADELANRGIDEEKQQKRD
jgi:ribonuclease HI